MTDVNNQNQSGSEGSGGVSGVAERPWLSTIPEAFRGHEAFKSANSMEEVFKGHADLYEKSKGALSIPGETATDEDRANFRKTINSYLGVPESIEGYEIQKPELPDGMTYDDTMSDIILKTAHELQIPKEAVQTLFKRYNDYQIELHTKYDALLKEGTEKRVQALKNLWKNDYDKKSEETFKGLATFFEKTGVPEEFGGPAGMATWLKENALDTDPQFNWMWNKVFELISPDSIVKGSTLTKEEPGDKWYPNTQK